MKNIFTLILTFLVLSINAQTVYNITSSQTWNGSTAINNPCFDCVINVSEGAVITVNKNVTFSNVVVNGGTFVFNSTELLLWSNGVKFNGTKASFLGSSKITGNGFMSFNNSIFNFYGTANVLVNQSISMVDSKLAFNGNSYFLANSGNVDLTRSQLIAGDGLLSSKAYIYMNGGSLRLQDATSGVEVMNSNNYYFNWANYLSVPTNTSYKTTDNNKNCGTTGKNNCAAPTVWGPMSLTPTGMNNNLVLPVIIRDFSAASSNGSVNLTWTTAQESNSAYFSIEKSVDGSNWSVVGKVKAAGNSAMAVKYSYTDINNASVAHYRLKMVDLDNKAAYSDVRSIRSAGIAVSVKVYPNPATEYANVTLGANAGNSRIILVNQGGQVVAQKNVAANTSSVTFQLGQIANGTYAIRISDDKGADQTIKLLVQH
ncbi:MAG: T9SS type A sorting domain-containing protein [Chitinophagaceae bacterium]|nr:MAG: T9SS type A sorting domain-containing protein [Chitinophagaceae bacterium]